MTDAEKIERLQAALKPFADAGVVWLPANPRDNGVYPSTPDDYTLRGLRFAWGGEIQPLTVGLLREAARAMQDVDPEYIEKWGEEG